MANRFPLIVNESSRKIEELIAGDNLDLTGNGVAISGNAGLSDQYLKSNGSTLEWAYPGDVYTTLSQVVTNKTFQDCTISGATNIMSAIPNAALVNSSITVNGAQVPLGGSTTVTNTDTTYSVSAQDGSVGSQKIIRLSDSGGNTDDITLEAGTNMSIARVGDVVTLASSFTDTDTVTTVASAIGGTAVSGQVIIAAAGFASVSQSGQTITITGSNVDTITEIRAGTGQTLKSGKFTLLQAGATTLTQSLNVGTGEEEITITSLDTITRLKGGNTGSLTSGDVTLTGGNNVTVSQNGQSIEIESTDTNTVTQVTTGTNTLASGDFKFTAAGATNITQSTASGLTTIEISSTNDDTGASFSASGGVLKNNTNFELKNNNNFGANTILKWDSGNSQMGNSILTDDGSTVTVTGDFVVNGSQTTLDTTTLRVEDNIIELRKGASIVGSDGGIQVNRTTDSGESVTTFIQLAWYEAGGYWRSFDGSISNRLVTETETQTLTNKTLTSPSLTSPILGNATCTTINGVDLATSANSKLTIADTKEVEFQKDFLFTSDNNAQQISINFRLGGEVAYKSDTLASFSSTTSTQLRGLITDTTGTGSVVFQQSPIFVTSIATTSTAFNLLVSGVTDLSFASAATTLAIGNTSGTTTISGDTVIEKDLTVGSTVAHTITINGILNSENSDISIRGGDSSPMIVGRGGGAVATNTAMGNKALQANSGGSNCSAFGYEALFVNNSNNNTAFGYQALKINSDGEKNVAIGTGSMTLNEDGVKNVAAGMNSLQNNTVGNDNVCIGHYAGFNCLGSGNVLIGSSPDENATNATYAPPNITGDNQLVIGSSTEAWIRGNASFDVTIPNALTVDGDTILNGSLIVNGTTTTINSNVISVDDKALELAAVSTVTITATTTTSSTSITGISPTAGLIPGMAVTSITDGIDLGTGCTIVSITGNSAVLSNTVTGNGTASIVATGPSDVAATGGGLILKGTTDKTMIYDGSRPIKYWTFSESLELQAGKQISIANQLLLSNTDLGTSVINSSLTSVGTLTGLSVDGAISLGGRVKEKVFFNYATGLTPSSNTLTINTAGANTILGTPASTAINKWAFTSASLSNGESLTLSLILAGNTAATYGDDCSVDGVDVSTGVQWSGGSPPAATSNTDILTFIIVKDNSGITKVFGQGNTDFS
jgi:hypothetical protein